MSTEGWPDSVDFIGAWRNQEKRAMSQSRRPNPVSARDLLGPGMSSRGIEVLDWNSEECTFNGYFYSQPGALNTPDPTARWIGHVMAQDDNNGVQTVWEAEPPEGEAEEPPDDPEVPEPSESEPEPEPPTEGNVTPIRQMQRYFSVSPEGLATFTDWIASGSTSGGRIRDLADVKIFEPLLDHSVLLYDANYNEGEGAWVNHSWIPGIWDLQQQVQEALDDAEEALDLAESTFDVYRQDGMPTPGVAGIPDPIRTNSVWFDTDDGYRMRIWDPTSPDDPTFLHWVEIESASETDPAVVAQLNALDDQVNDELTGLSAAFVNAVTANSAVTNWSYTGTTEIDGGEIRADTITAIEISASAITSKHTITGAVFQTENTFNRGIKINSTGMIGYNSVGSTTFFLSASTGGITMTGPVLTSAAITGGSVTGATLQTSASSAVGVKITSSGLTAYNLSGTPALNYSTVTGQFTMTGSFISGGEINGAIVTGGTVQSSSASNTGVKFNSNGLAAYAPGGATTFVITASTGAITMAGGILSGGTLTGSTFRTALSKSNSIWISEDDPAVKGLMAFGPLLNSPILHIWNSGSNSQPVMIVQGGLDIRPPPAGRTALGEGFHVTAGASFLVQSSSPVFTQSPYIQGGLQIDGNLQSQGTIWTNQAITGAQLRASLHTTTANAANCFIRSSDGQLLRSTSSRRFKDDVRDLIVDPEVMLKLRPVSFLSTTLADKHDQRYVGFIAEDAADLGLEEWITRDQDGPETFDYPKWVVAQQAVMRFLWAEVKELRALLPPGKTKK